MLKRLELRKARGLLAQAECGTPSTWSNCGAAWETRGDGRPPARRPAAIATIAVAALAADAARASADGLVYRCGPNVCKAAPDGTAKQRLTTDGKPGGPLYSWLSASADGSRLAVVKATYAYVLDGRGRRLSGKLPRGGIGVIAEIAPSGASGAQVATVGLLAEVTPAPVGSPPGTPGLSGLRG